MRIRQAQPGDEAAMARVHVESWRTTYPGIMPDNVLENLDSTDREPIWRGWMADQDAAVFVAEDADDGIVGVAAGGPERSGEWPYDGELYAIYLLEMYQGQGIGRELAQAMGKHLIDQGIQSMLVWVAAGVPACGFYEAIGGRQVDRRPEPIAGVEIDVIGYGWDDVRSLTSEGTG